METSEVEAAVAALQELVQSEGWKHVLAYAQQEYGAKTSINQIAGRAGIGVSMEDAALAVARVMAAREAVDIVLSYPARAIAKYQKPVDTPAEAPPQGRPVRRKRS